MASRSLNKVTLIGNVGQDPDIRTTTGGGRVANFSLATSRVWNGPSGDRQEKTEWHKCVVWNTKVTSLADVVEKYVHKGTQLYVEGRIEYRTYQDKENQTRYVTEINVTSPTGIRELDKQCGTDIGALLIEAVGRRLDAAPRRST